MAKAKLENSRKNHELVKIGPRVEQIDYARAQAAQAKAQVDYAQTMLDSTLIRSPVTGTVLDRLVEKGEMVSTMTFGGTGGVKATVSAARSNGSAMNGERLFARRRLPRMCCRMDTSQARQFVPALKR